MKKKGKFLILTNTPEKNKTEVEKMERDMKSSIKRTKKQKKEGRKIEDSC
jgi:hypothetical protein